MIHVDLETNEFNVTGNIHTISREIVTVIGTVCAEYTEETGKVIVPEDVLKLGISLLIDEERDSNV